MQVFDRNDVQGFNEWYKLLPEEEQKKVFILIRSKSSEAVLDYFEENHQEQFEFMNVLINYLKKSLKVNSSENVTLELKEQGIDSLEFKELIVGEMLRELEIYFDSKILREVNTSDFRFVIGKMIKDVFVDRKYTYIGKMIEEFPNYSEEDLKNIKVIITFVTRNYFVNLIDADKISSFMKEEMEFSNEKINIFIDLIEKYSEKLEKYYLVKELKELRLEVSNLRDQISEYSEI